MFSRPAVTLLHATSVAMAPIHDAFASEWPEAALSNLLDDGLTTERAKSREVTDALIGRFSNLVRYAYEVGAKGILATCSAFGPAIEHAGTTVPIPVIKPNEAMFKGAIACGKRIAMIATFAPAVETMEAEFDDEARRAGTEALLTTFVVDRAMERLRAGDAASHNELIATCASELVDYDAILLAHFSTSRAAGAVRAATPIPVFTAPESAVKQLRDRMAC